MPRVNDFRLVEVFKTWGAVFRLRVKRGMLAKKMGWLSHKFDFTPKAMERAGKRKVIG